METFDSKSKSSTRLNPEFKKNPSVPHSCLTWRLHVFKEMESEIQFSTFEFQFTLKMISCSKLELMDRLQVIRMLLQNRKKCQYLEIGVFKGFVFFRIPSRFKVAVDPKFRFSFSGWLRKIFLQRFSFHNRYFSKTSDAFFAENAPRFYQHKRIDVALIDGMHEFAYALRDLENTLNYLADDGVILLHDCNPKSRDAACSFAEWKARGYCGDWNGDVWKVIVYLQCFRKDLCVFVLDCDHGLGVVTRRACNDSVLAFSKEEIESFRYDDLEARRNEFLNLKPPSYFYEYFGFIPRKV